MTVVQSLAREIGAHFWRKLDDRRVIAAWTRLLAKTVSDLTFPQRGQYGDKVIAWADEIQAAPDDQILAVCNRIHDEILAIDFDDGWPTDKTGNAINAVCLCAMFGIGDPEHTRWPAEASSTVWGWATGAGLNGNEVVSISRAAWQRHLFSQALALAALPLSNFETEEPDG